MKVFISQPMGRKTDEEIQRERERAIKCIKQKFPGEVVEIIDSFIKECYGTPLEFLGRSIQLLAGAKVAYFVSGWRDARGCLIEYECAKQYGIRTIVEDESETRMDFGEALKYSKHGRRITRDGWNGQGLSVVYQKAYPDGIPCNSQTAKAWGMREGELFRCEPYLQISTVDGSHAMWVPSIRDLLADDWWFADC